jgi:flagellar biosynthesis protein FlhF
MRHVLRRVREDQGPDAVILSNRRVEGGIEVIAALDYDEALVRHALGSRLDSDQTISSDALAEIAETDNVKSAVEILSTKLQSVPTPELAETNDELTLQTVQSELSSLRGLLETQLSELVWNDSASKYPLRAQVLRNLSRLGVAPDVAQLLIDRLGPIDDIKNIWTSPLSALAKALPVTDDQLLQKGGIIALIGPTGVGKTTTIAKIAAQYAMHSWSDDIALISADSYRIGAKEHLMAFANIIGTKVYAASNFDELSETLDRLRGKKLILIDTEGRSQRDRELSGRLAAYGRNEERVKFYLTLSATAQEAAIDETIQAFSQVPLAGAIVTKIDEAAQLGCVMSALIRNDLPAAWFTDGQRIPEDLHCAARKKLWLVNQAVACMEASQPRIDERTMAENFAQMSSSHV